MKSKVTGRAASIPRGLAAGGAVSLAVTILISAILAWLIDKEIMVETKIGYGVMVMLLLASFLGAMIASGMIKHQRMMVSLMSGAVYFGILLSITALFFGGQYNAIGVTCLLILGGSGCSALLSVRQGRGHNYRNIHRRNR